MKIQKIEELNISKKFNLITSFVDCLSNKSYIVIPVTWLFIYMELCNIKILPMENPCNHQTRIMHKNYSYMQIDFMEWNENGILFIHKWSMPFHFNLIHAKMMKKQQWQNRSEGVYQSFTLTDFLGTYYYFWKNSDWHLKKKLDLLYEKSLYLMR